ARIRVVVEEGPDASLGDLDAVVVGFDADPVFDEGRIDAARPKGTSEHEAGQRRSAERPSGALAETLRLGAPRRCARYTGPIEHETGLRAREETVVPMSRRIR